MKKVEQCEYCLHLTYDEVYEEFSCSIHIDQDDMERLRFSLDTSCPYFRLRDVNG